ncbi:hypothetical protein IPZ58_16415 [Streptomyces roseoverticillatus]|uniref:hypothetical protein n=1 Tax=Streptomyces roseoverticillatus TaxID=66429 RepID=UPI001F35DD16|nr:hypothetical protein [Streptomyces roseoverticillatus]MCF3103156.1 hypothetical protein [Streptomyces roseoverticillatus]
MCANAKSGDQGRINRNDVIITRNGVIEGWDFIPGGDVDPQDAPTVEDVLRHYLYQHHAVAYAYAWAGLLLTDARAIFGAPNTWVDLPDRDYWHT